MKYSEEQIRILEKYYPGSNYDELFKAFPGRTKKEIGQIARSRGIRCNNPGHRIELTGQRFGRLFVEGIDHIDKKGVVFWKCKCDCGNETIARTCSLRGNQSQSCGCLKRELTSKNTSTDHTGKKFGMLMAVERLPHYNGKKRTYYRCICDCGREKIVSGSNLIKGHTKTCGCIGSRKEFYSAFPREKDNEKPQYLVYKHITPNGKIYIGITKQDAERRWQNGKGYKTQKKFWRAIRKYGWEQFKHEILAQGLTEERACELEEQFIKDYQSTDSRYGYNASTGGTTGRDLVTPVMQYYYDKPVNFFESITIAAKLLGVSVTTIRNYSKKTAIINGYSFETLPQIHLYDIDPTLYEYEDESHYVVGKLMLNERSKKTIERNKASGRPVNQYDMEGHFIKTYGSIADAERENRVSKISSVVKKKSKYKSAGGFQWRYFEGNTDDIAPLHANGREIMQLDPDTYALIAEYYSMADAERATGVASGQIFKSCNRTHITSGGFIWRYRDDPDAFKPIEKKEPEYACVPVNQYSLDGKYITTYESVAEAERQNPNANSIYAVISKNVISKSSGGYMWAKDTGNHKDIDPYHANGRFVEQIDINTGQIIKTFSSLRAGQMETGAKNIVAVCSGKRKSSGGYIWRYKYD